MKKKNCRYATQTLFLILFFQIFNIPGLLSQSGPEKTAFQTTAPWKPGLDVRADMAIVYGIRDYTMHDSTRHKYSFEDRVKSWLEKGYQVSFMTGIAWGEYQDYFNGSWDGKKHFDEGQRNRKGDTIWHNPGVPYIVPTRNFLQYMQQVHIKRVIDAGVDAIFLEEPEFWAFAGYSDAFKREWKDYYGFDWKPQDESAQNLYLSNKLKYHLYYRALQECFTFAKNYGKSKGMNVRCYVPTHSLINYSQWQIVSPEASLASLSCVDGYIAQVWTGTSRVLNYFQGLARERVFETAYLEYGTLQSMTAPTGRKVFFLTDPIEDQPRDWSDFRKNYQATFTAKILYPQNNNYEVMPWPERIYEGLYQVSEHSNQKANIPRAFSTQMQVMINALNQIPLSDNHISGSPGISVLMSNSLMFQRNDQAIQDYEDPQLSDFFGLAMPLLKRGVPVSILHMENTSYPQAWKDTRVLMMTYSNMKPMAAEQQQAIADWVKQGGTLIYVSRDTDPFQSVKEWWNTGENHFLTPADHLFGLMNLPPSSVAGCFQVGKGLVRIIRQDPKEFVMTPKGDQVFISLVKEDYEHRVSGGKLIFKNYFSLTRGPYHMISVMDESVKDTPYALKGRFVDLFNPELPVVTRKTVLPGEQAFLYDLKDIQDPAKPQVIASASRVYCENLENHVYTMVVKSPLHTTNVMRIYFPGKPRNYTIKDNNGALIRDVIYSWDEKSNTCFLKFENQPEGIKLEFNW